MRNPQDILVQRSLSSMLKYEILIGQQTGKRGYHLKQAYQMLLTISATSVKAERAFSSSGYICNKSRTRLNDSNLDKLLFIRNNLKKEKK